MKILTLNTHSWLEENPEKKLQQLAEKIMQESYDLIALQEVNQKTASEVITQPAGFCPCPQQTEIHADNFAYCLVQLLKKAGICYFWSWEMSHIGYDIYQEGNALLSKHEISPEAFLVSEKNDPADYRTRKLLLGETIIAEKKVTAISCHFSWWINETEGFAYEWRKLQTILEKNSPLFLMGDFNNPDPGPGYQLLELETLGLADSFYAAEKKTGAATVVKKIDGWAENTEALRIDYIFLPETVKATTHQVVFDGENGPVISDHFGVEVELEEF